MDTAMILKINPDTNSIEIVDHLDRPIQIGTMFHDSIWITEEEIRELDCVQEHIEEVIGSISSSYENQLEVLEDEKQALKDEIEEAQNEHEKQMEKIKDMIMNVRKQIQEITETARDFVKKDR